MSGATQSLFEPQFEQIGTISVHTAKMVYNTSHVRINFPHWNTAPKQHASLEQLGSQNTIVMASLVQGYPLMGHHEALIPQVSSGISPFQFIISAVSILMLLPQESSSGTPQALPPPPLKQAHGQISPWHVPMHPAFFLLNTYDDNN